MQYIFFAAGITGIIMLFFGLKWTIRGIRHKAITQFNFSENPNEVYFQKPGLYSLNFIGGLRANSNKDFSVSISKNARKQKFMNYA